MELETYINRIELVDYLVILVNFLLLIFARRILTFFQAEDTDKSAFLFKVQSIRRST